MNQQYSKPALSWQQQIAHLRTKGMEIEDEARAEYWLRHVSYYRLSAYWLYFEYPKEQPGPRFRPGTSFDRVTALYDFDRLLRRLVMRGAEHVEVALRGSWAYQMGQLGDGHTYLTPNIYKNAVEFGRNVVRLRQEVDRSNETYIKHYRENYSQPEMPPVWMVAEMMSFGQLSRWYSNIKQRQLRTRIAKPLGFSETVLVPLVRHITDIRNTCAHHGRLWNRGYIHPPQIAQNPEDLYQSLNQAATQSPARLYNSLCMITHIVRTVAPNSSWQADLAAHLTTHPEQDWLSMGCPENWQETPLWKGFV